MDLTNNLKDYLPHQQRGSTNFDSLLKEVGILLDEIGTTIDEMKYYSDFDKIPQKLLNDYAQMFGMNIPRNMGISNRRLLIRDIMNIHKTNGTEKALKFLFNIVGLSIVIDYIWSIDPTTTNNLAYQATNPFTYSDISSVSDWKRGHFKNRVNYLPILIAIGNSTTGVLPFFKSTFVVDSSKSYQGANSIKVTTNFSTNLDSGVYSFVSDQIPSGVYSVSARVWFPSGQSFRFGGMNSITNGTKSTTYTGTGAWQYVKSENITYDFATDGFPGFQCHAVGTSGQSDISFWIDVIQVEPGATATTFTDTETYISPLIDLTRVNGYDKDKISWSSTEVSNVAAAYSDAYFENFNSSLSHAWDINTKVKATTDNSKLNFYTLADANYTQIGVLQKQSLAGYERASISVNVDSFQSNFGMLICGNYIRMYNNSGTNVVQILTQDFTSGKNYTNVTHTYTPSTFDPQWRFEINTDNTIDFYMGYTLAISGISRTEDKIGFWTDALANTMFYADSFEMAYSVADYVFSTVTSGNSMGVFSKHENLTNKALIISKTIDSSSLSGTSAAVSTTINGTGLFYSDGSYVSLLDYSNVAYDRLEIMGENYASGARTTTSKAVKTPYIRITVTQEDYNLFTSDYTDPTTGKVYSYTTSERYKITQEIINYFMNQGRPANVVVTQISTPFALDDLIPYSLSDASTLTQVDAGWVYDGTVNYGMDTDRYILGETFSGFNFGNTTLTLETSPPTVNVTRTYPIGTSGLQEYVPTRKNAKITLSVPSDATVRIYTSTSDRITLSKGTYTTQILTEVSNNTNFTQNISNVFAVMINIVTPSSTGSIDFTVTEL